MINDKNDVLILMASKDTSTSVPLSSVMTLLPTSNREYDIIQPQHRPHTFINESNTVENLKNFPGHPFNGEYCDKSSVCYSSQGSTTSSYVQQHENIMTSFKQHQQHVLQRQKVFFKLYVNTVLF